MQKLTRVRSTVICSPYEVWAERMHGHRKETPLTRDCILNKVVTFLPSGRSSKCDIISKNETTSI